MYFDKFKLRDMNERVVLEALIANQPVSRIELSKITRLNKASITNIVNVLIDKKLVNEIGYGESQNSGGRRPILLELNHNAGCALSIDVGNNYISAIITDLNGSVINSYNYRDFDLMIGASNIYDNIDSIVDKFKKDSANTVYGVVAMVIAIHGVVLDNHIKEAPNYNLIGLNLHKNLSEKYSFPVYLENEANLATLGQISVSHEVENAVLLSIHTGIGAGVIIDRNLYTGARGAAGEVGHITLYPHGRKCRCGKEGCLEQYSSSAVIYNEFLKHYPDVDITHETLRTAFTDNIDFKEVVIQSTHDLAIGLQTIISHFDPEIIYIVSEVFLALPELKNTLEDYLRIEYNRDVPIEISDINYGAILIGGASLGISEFLGTERFILNRSEIKNNA